MTDAGDGKERLVLNGVKSLDSPFDSIVQRFNFAFEGFYAVE